MRTKEFEAVRAEHIIALLRLATREMIAKAINRRYYKHHETNDALNKAEAYHYIPPVLR